MAKQLIDLLRGTKLLSIWPSKAIARTAIDAYIYIYMGVSKNRGTPKSSILIRFSIINHPFWGTTIFGNIHIWAAAFIYDVAAVKKIHGVPPPRFDLVFQVSALFHHEWSCFHHEWPRFNIVLKCFKPTSFLESPHLVLISFCRRKQHFHKPCLTPHLVFIIVNKCSCSYIVGVCCFYFRDGQFWASLAYCCCEKCRIHP